VTIRCLLALVAAACLAGANVEAQVNDGLEEALRRLLDERDAPTVLELSESARREVAQDELRASLTAHAEAPEPTAAQDQVNRMMGEAVELARAAPGVRVSTGGYNVYHDQPEKRAARWVAEQSLSLTGSDANVLLDLVGKLQAKGLAVQDLQWTLAAATRRNVERQLLGEALDALSRTARTAAEGLSLEFTGWRRVSLTPGATPMPPAYRARVAMAAEAMATPVAVAGTSEVVVNVSAEALLSRR
jgi:predicted secreted protein